MPSTECLAICLYTVALVVCVHGNTNSNELVTNTSTQQSDVQRVRDYRLALIEQFFQGASKLRVECGDHIVDSCGFLTDSTQTKGNITNSRLCYRTWR